MPLWLWAVLLERRHRAARQGNLVASTESAR
jgi:DHA1 family inner membrane transport protein